jgi:acyl-CoA thioester hydrolase
MIPFELPTRVYYEDTDAGGVVYYANYLKFFERCRTEYLRHLGIEQKKMAEEQSIYFVVRSAQLDFISPARLDDHLTVTLQIEKLGRASLVVSQTILRNLTALVHCTTKIACVHGSAFTPTAMPENLHGIIAQSMNQTT